MKCFFHRSDFDGKCSGALIKQACPECSMIPITYGEAFPWESLTDPDEIVFMVDFSLQPFDDMERLNKMVKLVWIDHHKTALDEAYNRGFLASAGQLISTEYAGCELTWKYLYDKASIPTFVYYLGRYDVWKHENVPGALEFQYGLRGRGPCWPDDPIWKDLYDDKTVHDIVCEGTLLLKHERTQNAIYMKACGFESSLDGYKCIAVNKGSASSMMFDSVYDPEKHDIMVTFVYRRPKYCTVSLYTKKDDIDVSAIAKKYGGGGHKQAAGFQCTCPPFET